MALYANRDMTGKVQLIDDKDPNFSSLVGGNFGNKWQPLSAYSPDQQKQMISNQKILNSQGQTYLSANPQYDPAVQASSSATPTAPTPITPTVSTNPPSVSPDTPPLPVIPGLSTPQTPVNTSTVPQTDISPFIPTTSQQQQDVVNQAIGQSQGVAGQNLQQLQGLISPYISQQFSQYTDPNSSSFQSLTGQLNNAGVASGGAFPQALADKLAPLISQGALNLGQEALAPSFINQQSLINQGAGVQSNLGLDPLQRYVEQQNFQQQSQLANQLAQQGASSQFGSGIGGLVGGGLGAWGGGLAGAGTAVGGPGGALIGAMLGSGAGKAAGGGASGTWICGHLKKLGLATNEEVESVHVRLRPSIFRHPIHWLHYYHSAPRLILLADSALVDWKAVKEVLIDAVLDEPDSEKSWQIYRAECERLCARYAPELWSGLEVFKWS